MRRSRRASSLLAALLLVMVMAAPALADTYHYKNILVGDRASGMGGAYTAVADDPSGIYYNPAGLVYSQGTNISASANAYHNTSTIYKNALPDRDWKRKSSSLLPNFFGVVQKLGNGKLGIAYVVPDSVIEDQDQTRRNLANPLNVNDPYNYTINFNNKDSTHLFGVAYAQEYSDKLSWGMTLFYHHRSIERTINEVREFLGTGEMQWNNSYYESQEDGVRPVLGLMWTPADRFSFGVSISKTFLTGSRSYGQVTAMNPGTTSADAQIYLNALPYTSGTEREYPTIINIGAAYFASETFMAAAEMDYHTSETDPVDGTRSWVMNISAGMEKYTSPNIAVRAGIFTNLASSPDLRSEYVNQKEHVDMYGLSGSVSHFGRGSSLTLGMSYAWGSGEAQVVGNDPTIQDVDVHSTTIFLSNAYGF